MISVIMACHNRREETLRCLAALQTAASAIDDRTAVYLVDDGSSDGTAAAVEAQYPLVHLIRGRGDLYWAGAMAMAERRALDGPSAAILWLNDDVVLDRDALRTLKAALPPDGVAVGALRDREGQLSYSGVRRVGRHPMHFTLVAPGADATTLQTFNGNAVLISRAACERVGSIDASLRHRAADYDWGLRAVANGCEVRLVSKTIGVCDRGARRELWLEPDEPLGRRVAAILSPKGVPPRPLARYLRRHGGIMWWFYWTLPYARFVASTVGLKRLGRPAALGPRSATLESD